MISPTSVKSVDGCLVGYKIISLHRPFIVAHYVRWSRGEVLGVLLLARTMVKSVQSTLSHLISTSVPRATFFNTIYI